MLLSLLACDFDAVVLTETWLHSGISSAELSSNYVLYRCDRNSLSSHLSRGGGGLIAVKFELNCSSVHLVDCESLEQTAVRIILPRFSLFICSIYIRPNSHVDTYARHVESIHQIQQMANPDDVIVILGDYNLPNLVWTFDDDFNSFLPLNASTEQELALVEPTLSSGLYQINDLLNANGKLLDLTFVNNPDRVSLVDYPSALLKVDDHHKPLALIVNFCSRMEDDSSSRSELDFSRCDYHTVNNKIASLDWDRILDHTSVDNAVSTFYEQLNEIIRETVPLKAQRSRNFNQPWWTPQLRNLRNRLRKARKRFLHDKTPIRRRELHEAEEKYKNLQLESFRKYINALQSTFKQNPTSFWSFVRNRKNLTRIPDKIVYQSSNSDSPLSSANLFAEFFQNMYESNSSQPTRQYIDSLPSYNLRFPVLVFDEDVVHKALSSVDATKGTGPDLIPRSSSRTVQRCSPDQFLWFTTNLCARVFFPRLGSLHR
ncbi:uncharacterized protein LOC129766609 [Toxorhynchites rutilus septentrionalis]|uniref:uncharacterized protein LOC129766609 n=1 Tax=Toxorhynchites rutilus septentrionalis TaxID=329112 RepID=UPI002479F8F0|nr:uncharacterized protein LOC129766609 [Toxorhynchites rutilus septentrionalis]